ncbi:hypothetical protein SMICM17S_07161 [Streptomyces microflavus]
MACGTSYWSQHPELPPVRMAVVPTPPPSKHLAERWHRDGDVVTELSMLPSEVCGMVRRQLLCNLC